MRARKPVIAVGIDAAEGQLVRRLAGEGRLPTLARLSQQSGWGRVTSPAPIGSGAVWPTFATGHPPDVHGFFGEYRWNPATMRLTQRDETCSLGFWHELAAGGFTVAVIDVPFAGVAGHERLIEIANWGAHDWCGPDLQVSPSSMRDVLSDLLATPHPLATGTVDSEGPADFAGLRHVARTCLAGVKRRGELAARVLEAAAPDLLLVVFPELHRASHLLWHTIDDEHPVWQEPVERLPDDLEHGLTDVLGGIDEQIDRLVSHGSGTGSALVFSLHGMESARGIPAFLDDVLERWGLAVRSPWWQRSPREHAGLLARAAKDAVPHTVKAMYYRHASRTLARRLAQPVVPMPVWDWAQTRAFSIPSDQHGWLRINLAGREARGIVPRSAYEATCLDLVDRLLGLSSAEGPLVSDVKVVATDVGRPPRHLPDLVVHWSPLARRARLLVLDPPLDAAPVGLKFVAQHAPNGFFVGSGLGPGWGGVVDAGELGRLLGATLRARGSE